MSDWQSYLAKLRDDPALFVTQVIGATPQKWQKQALENLRDNDRVAVKSGHGVGKTAFLSWAILWFLSTRYPVKVAVTANTASQLNDVLWSEIRKWHGRMNDAFASQLEIKSDKITLVGGEDSFAVARTARRDQPEALAGFHADNMLFVVDEASGVPEIIFETAQGALSTEGAKIIMVGNPTRAQGYFFDAFNKNADRWAKQTVSSEDADYVQDAFIADMASQYGDESNAYRVRVLGEFPTGDSDSLIPRHLVEAAMQREVEPTLGVAPVWGLDVARFGADRTALAKRRGNELIEPVKSWQDLDTMQVVGRVIQEYDATPYDDRPSEILIDVIGLGAGVVDRLREIDLGPQVRGVNVSESPAMASKYAKLRDELWGKTRAFFEERDCTIPDDEKLIAELTAPTFTFLSTGKMKVEGKDEMKRRGLKSPDLADAFVLTFAGQAARAGSAAGYRYAKTIGYDDSWIV